MKDTEIIKLYFDRTESAISETAQEYGAYLFSIAWNILKNKNDAEEIINDTYQVAWNTIPPENPAVLRHYLARITRNLSLKRLEYNSAGKRSCNGIMALEELEECIPHDLTVENVIEAKELGELINRFLSLLAKDDVTIFLLRYFYLFYTDLDQHIEILTANRSDIYMDEGIMERLHNVYHFLKSEDNLNQLFYYNDPEM